MKPYLLLLNQLNTSQGFECYAIKAICHELIPAVCASRLVLGEEVVYEGAFFKSEPPTKVLPLL